MAPLWCWVAAACIAASAPQVQNITVSGNQFLENGVPWVANGVTLMGLGCPDSTGASCTTSFMTTAVQLLAADGQQEILQAKSWGVNTIRFAISQPALDPNSPYYQGSTYLNNIVTWVRYCRSQGLIVMLTMQWENEDLETGWSGQLGHPTTATSGTGGVWSSTEGAWLALVPYISSDNGIIIELFAEPSAPSVGPSTTPAQAWTQWAAYANPVIAAIRSAGANNVILLQPIQIGQSWQDAPNNVTGTTYPNGINDAAGEIGYSVHPYETDATAKDAMLGGSYWFGSNGPSDFDLNFGDYAATYAVVISEYTAYASDGSCFPPSAPDSMLASPTYAKDLLNYALGTSGYRGGSAGTQQIGIAGGWGFDVVNSLVANISASTTNFQPLSWSNWSTCGGPSVAAGIGFDFQQMWMWGYVPAGN